MVPMQYCSLQHWTLLSAPDTSTAKHPFRFGPASAAFMELFLLSSPVAYWTATNWGAGGLILWCHIFLPLHTVHGVLKAGMLSDLPFPSPVDDIFSELYPITCPSWVTD